MPSRKPKRRTISGVTKMSCGVCTKLRFASRKNPKPLPEISITPSPNSSSRCTCSPLLYEDPCCDRSRSRSRKCRSCCCGEGAVSAFGRVAISSGLPDRIPGISPAGIADDASDSVPPCSSSARVVSRPACAPSLCRSADGCSARSVSAVAARSSWFPLRAAGSFRVAWISPRRPPATRGRRFGLQRRGLIIGFFAHNNTRNATGAQRAGATTAQLLKPATSPATRRQYLNSNRRFERRRRLRGSRTTATPGARSPHRRQELSYRE